MEYVTVKSYDGKLVRVPEEKLEEYIKSQEEIKKYLKEGKTIKEIKEIINERENNRD